MEMVATAIKCPHCGSIEIVKCGKQSNGKQRLKCKTCTKIFQQDYSSNGAKPEIKLQIIKMSLNGSGVRDISRVLDVSPNTVIDVLKKLKIFLTLSIRDIKILRLQ